MSPPPPIRKLALGMAGMLTTVGILHFAAPKPFDTIVPAELPGSPVLHPRLRRGRTRDRSTAGRTADPAPGRHVAIALFLAVFPANVNMVRLWWGKPWPMRRRSPGCRQIPMIVLANRVRRAILTARRGLGEQRGQLFGAQFVGRHGPPTRT
jgi:uncharacterized membrane protein